MKRVLDWLDQQSVETKSVSVAVVNKDMEGENNMAINNEILNCIRERRSTRRFTDQQISPEQLDALLDAAIWAPSGSNSQSWLFTAIQNSDVLLHLNELVREGFQHWIPDDDYPGKLAIKERSQKEGYNFYYQAPTLIIASNRPNYENAMADCALALENIFLAAHSLQLGSCYINQLHWLRDDPGVREYLFELGIPKEHTICSSAAIGFRGAEAAAPIRKDGTINIIR
ncbi:nitroreductase [Desulfosporosinus orientis DSM 765]|uniref:Nitroreductase n=2 Tax=Desulfosporosinus orientis TaxID=1563 RepID=G7WFC5_DESOD|nr:nitroreductase [Desulfosporosinus orientis DSM 765]